MEIKDHKVVTTSRWHKFNIEIGELKCEVNVQSVNGVVIGTYKNNMFTSNSEYNLLPEETKASHFEVFKACIKETRLK